MTVKTLPVPGVLSTVMPPPGGWVAGGAGCMVLTQARVRVRERHGFRCFFLIALLRKPDLY
jgi:hypothetical protein